MNTHMPVTVSIYRQRVTSGCTLFNMHHIDCMIAVLRPHLCFWSVKSARIHTTMALAMITLDHCIHSLTNTGSGGTFTWLQLVWSLSRVRLLISRLTPSQCKWRCGHPNYLVSLIQKCPLVSFDPVNSFSYPWRLTRITKRTFDDLLHNVELYISFDCMAQPVSKRVFN